MAVINYEIYKVLGTLSEDKDGRKKQLTCTSWGRYNPKFDLRAWNEEYTAMTKGITLTLEEITTLRDMLNDIDLESVLAESIQERLEAKASETTEEDESKATDEVEKAAKKATTAKKVASKTATSKKTTTAKKTASTSAKKRTSSTTRKTTAATAKKVAPKKTVKKTTDTEK